MAVIFTQTDATATCGQTAYCSAMPVGSPNNNNRRCTPGGTPGVTPASIQVNASDADHIYIWFELIVQDGSAWNAGNWTVRLDVSTANAAISWDQVDICRINSSCVSQASIGVQGGVVSMAGTGVKTFATITGSAQAPNNGDKVMVLLTFSNIAGVGSNLSFLPDVNIDSPFDPPPPPQDAGRNWMYYNTSIRM